jgi:TonB family protein
MTTLRMSFVLILAASSLSGVFAGSPYSTRGVTADGHSVVAAPNTHRPWAADLLAHPKPEMPASLRANHVGGEALCRIRFEVESGRVRDVLIAKSSGYPELDASIVRTVRQGWKVRPGTWKEFEIYIGIWAGSPPPRR